MKSGKAEVARERFGEPLAREDREPGEKEEMREESTKVGYSMARVIARRHVRNARCKCDREKKGGGRRKGGRRRRETRRKRERFERGTATRGRKPHERAHVSWWMNNGTPHNTAISPIPPPAPLISHLLRPVSLTLRFSPPPSRLFPPRRSTAVSRGLYFKRL